jgi:hypothetical protein
MIFCPMSRVLGLRHPAEPCDDRLGGGFDALHGVFKGLPSSFSHLVTVEVPGDWPAETGRLVHLHDDRAAVV